MNYQDAFKRSVATFVAAAASALVVVSFTDTTPWIAALQAGVAAVINLAGRSAQAYLAKTKV